MLLITLGKDIFIDSIKKNSIFFNKFSISFELIFSLVLSLIFLPVVVFS
jgi:hypothetical protein